MGLVTTLVCGRITWPIWARAWSELLLMNDSVK